MIAAGLRRPLPPTTVREVAFLVAAGDMLVFDRLCGTRVVHAARGGGGWP